MEAQQTQLVQQGIKKEGFHITVKIGRAHV